MPCLGVPLASLSSEVYLRPMMSRVREALFSMLYQTGVLRESASHLDLFAGAGTVGLEAISRGIYSYSFEGGGS